MAVTQYIGSRYVPLFADPIEWSSSNTYEPLTIVIHEGNSYTSRQAVPKGIDISNEGFWALTGNYNAQVELYRRETAAAREVADSAQADATAAQTDIDTLLPKADFSAENTVKKYVDDSVSVVQTDIDTLLPKADFSAENTVKKYVDDSLTTAKEYADNINKITYPEFYGAVGDGVTDDTTAFRNMFDAINIEHKPAIIELKKNANYYINLTAHLENVVIVGNGATLNGKDKTALIADSTSHDIVIENCVFNNDVDIDNIAYSCAGFSLASSDVSQDYECYNVIVRNCTFNAGVFGFTADNSKNIVVDNCVFYNGYYNAPNSAGGYHILEQSCTNFDVNNCVFDMGKYSRHAIYVSVNQNKPTSKESKNVKISNCIFDQSKMELIGNARYSPNTPVLMVRAVNNLTVCDCIAYNITGFVSAVSSDGALNNIDIHNITVDGFVFLSTSQAPSEARYIISIAGVSDNYASANIYNIVQKSDSLKANQSYSFIYCKLSIHDLINEYRIYLAYCTVDITNIQIRYSEALYLSGNDMLTGSIRNISGPQVKLFNDGGLVDLGCIDSNLISHIWLNSQGSVRFAATRPFLNHSIALDNGQVILTLPNVANSDVSMLHCVNRDPAYRGVVGYPSYNSSEHTVRLLSYFNNTLVSEGGHYSYNLYIS